MERFVEHWATPDNGIIRMTKKKPKRDVFNTEFCRRDELLFVVRNNLTTAEKRWNTWTVEVAIDQTHLSAGARERYREVHRYGRFTNPTLS
jgi:hypothetical protein